MSDIATLDTSIAAVKTTTSGEVEYHGNISLQKVISDIRDLLQARNVILCTNVSDMQTKSSAEGGMAFVSGIGFFGYYASDPANKVISYAATGGGYWAKVKESNVADSLDWSSTPPTNGQSPVWNSGQGKYVPGTVSVTSLGWANITSKPIITGTTNPSIAGNLAVGGTLAITGASTLTGNVSMPGALNVGGTTTLTGDVTLDDNLQVNNSISCDGDLTVTSGTTTLSDAVIASLALTTITGLANYASNAAALTGFSNAIGRVYRNGDNLCVTH